MANEMFTDVNGEQSPIVRNGVVTLTTDTTLTYEDSGNTFLIATDALTITLPDTKIGISYKFINSGAAGNNIITVSPQAADGIAGTVTLASSVVVLDGTIDKDAINTKATSQAGDSLCILGTGTAGTTAWLVEGSTGIWAQEA